MVVIDLVKFAACLIVVGTVLRLAETKLSDTAVGKALSFAY